MNAKEALRALLVPALLIAHLQACKPSEASEPPPTNPFSQTLDFDPQGQILVQNPKDLEDLPTEKVQKIEILTSTPFPSPTFEKTPLPTETVFFSPPPTATAIAIEAPLTIPKVTPTSTLKPPPTPTLEVSPISQPESQPEIQLALLEEEMFAAINATRKEFGQPELTLDFQLVEIARIRSRDMAKRSYFSHHDPEDGKLAFVKLLEKYHVSYSRAGENLARNNVPDNLSVVTALAGFLGSGSHRTNMLSPKYQKIGVGGVIREDQMKYLTFIFLTP